MGKFGKWSLVLAILVPTVVWGQVAVEPGAIRLNVPILDDTTGKPIKNDATREQGNVVLVPFSYGGKDYVKGEKIIDPDTMRYVQAQLQSENKMFSLQPIDPTCAKCKSIDVGWVLGSALHSSICKTSQTMPKVPPQCTPDEEKAEADWQTVAERDALAKKIAEADGENGSGYISIGPKSLAIIINLIEGHFAAAPSIIAQTMMVLTPNAKLGEFGKD